MPRLCRLFGRRTRRQSPGLLFQTDESSQFNHPEFSLQAFTMAYLIGTDEAGYGPNLGPLVVTATLWQVPDELPADGLYTALAGVVSRLPTSDARCGEVPIADSKTLYKSSGDLKMLERGVLAAWRTLGLRPDDWREAIARAAPPDDLDWDDAPWNYGFERSLPLHHDWADLDRLADGLGQGLRGANIRLLQVRSRVVPPQRFNDELARHGNKASVLSTLTLDLIRTVLAECDDHPAWITCDKHGGRQRYAEFVQQAFPECLVEIYGECRSRSLYRWGPAHGRKECCFLERAERLLSVALASMASKYLRELAMLAFNAFWQRHLPNLRPTAGYPEDARRFRREIEDCRTKLGIPDHVLWRNR